MARFAKWFGSSRDGLERFEGLDLGNGRQLAAEDILEGHFSRLSVVRPGQTRTETISVQVDKEIKAAITVLAPDLAPLAEVAEEVASAVPNVRPEQEFRRTLHRALEQTHRQHAAQRALGTRRPLRTDEFALAKPGVGLAFALMFIALFAVWLLWPSPDNAAVNTPQS